jgi:hypothetical protein
MAAMSQTSSSQTSSSSTSSGPPPIPGARSANDEAISALTAPWTPDQRTSNAWQGWAFFGAAVMILLGLFQALFGLVALFDQQYFTLRANKLLVVTSYTAWGWLHLVGGALALAAGLGIILGGHTWARILGIVVAALSAVVNLGYLEASPVWSVLIIVLDVLVIYALTVHGREIDDR